jgi:hypothetical protein
VVDAQGSGSAQAAAFAACLAQQSALFWSSYSTDNGNGYGKAPRKSKNSVVQRPVHCSKIEVMDAGKLAGHRDPLMTDGNSEPRNETRTAFIIQAACRAVVTGSIVAGVEGLPVLSDELKKWAFGASEKLIHEVRQIKPKS